MCNIRIVKICFDFVLRVNAVIARICAKYSYDIALGGFSQLNGGRTKRIVCHINEFFDVVINKTNKGIVDDDINQKSSKLCIVENSRIIAYSVR